MSSALSALNVPCHKYILTVFIAIFNVLQMSSDPFKYSSAADSCLRPVTQLHPIHTGHFEATRALPNPPDEGAQREGPSQDLDKGTLGETTSDGDGG